jgi:nitrogen fixation protein NifX
MSLQRHLRIVAANTDPLPMATALKIAFATTDRRHVNQHFGSAQSFVIYAVTPEQTRLIEVAQFGDLLQDGHEDKLATKLALLTGCAAVFCQAVGGSAIRQLLSLGIQPLRVPDNAVIEQLLNEFQRQWRTGALPWLSRALQRQQDDHKRFDAMEAEGWQG